MAENSVKKSANLHSTASLWKIHGNSNFSCICSYSFLYMKLDTVVTLHIVCSLANELASIMRPKFNQELLVKFASQRNVFKMLFEKNLKSLVNVL